MIYYCDFYPFIGSPFILRSSQVESMMYLLEEKSAYWYVQPVPVAASPRISHDNARKVVIGHGLQSSISSAPKELSIIKFSKNRGEG